MKMKKKLLPALALTASLLGGTAAMAADGTYSGTSSYPNSYPNVELKTTVDETCTLVIPPVLNIPYGSASTDLPIEVTDLHCSTGKKLYVKVTTFNGYLATADGDRISYSISGGVNDNFLSNRGFYFTKTGKEALKINITDAQWKQAKAGDYSNTITFTFAIAKLSN